MFSKRELEGYLEIDHRESPGFDDATAHFLGLGGLSVGKGKRCQIPTLTCAHCQKQMVVNPLRTRDREICQKCNGYVCDPCKTTVVLTGRCYSWKQREEDFHRKAALQQAISRGA